MNKTCYKVIFNKKRGMMMAVAENTTRDGKHAQDGSEIVSDGLCSGFRLQTAAFCVWLAIGTAWVTPTSAAGILADKAAPASQQPTILKTANGLPQVNIQTPSAGGVSVNQYHQFDVDKQGAVLNNSRGSAQTRLAGWVQGNPWLARGEAKVIVNQINSSNPSLLNGYVEIAGKRADVIMANPAGIRINGAGFINAAGVTLTTGKPMVDNGDLSRFQVRDGNISISGGGLDTSDADYTRILARAAQINAGIWAKDLSVVSGRNDITADGRHTAVSDGRPAPAVAIDTAQLGGMYANKITLVSTDKGAAINNAGQIFAAAGGVTLSADGKVGNSGSLITSDNTRQSADHATIRISADTLDNNGTLSSQGKTTLSASSISNSGALTSADELHIRTQNLDNNKTIQAARFDIHTGRLNNSGDMAQTGLQGLEVNTGRLNNSGLIGFAPDNSHSANGGNNGAAATHNTPSTAAGAGKTQKQSQAASPITLAEGRLNVSDGLTNSGNLTANGGIKLNTTNSLANSGKLHLSSLNAQGALLDNRKGETLTRQAEISARTLDNRQGTLTATQTLNIQNHTTNNRQGTLQSGGALNATVNTLDNDNGKLTVNQQAEIHAANLSNQKGQIDAGRLKVETIRLNNHTGQIRSDEATELKVSDGLDNQSGLIGSAKDINIHDGGKQTLALNNASGRILAGRNLNLQAKTLAKQGELAANQNLSLALKDSFTTEQDIRAGKRLTLKTEGNLNNRHTLEGGKSVQLGARTINNTVSGTIQSGSDTRLKAQNLTNRGLINSNGLTLLQADDTVLNIGSGRIYGDHVAVGAQKLVNKEETVNGETKAAVIAAREHLAVGAKDITNQEGAILSSEGDLAIGGKLDGNNQTQGKAQTLTNASARIEAQGNGRIAVQSLKNLNKHFELEEYLAETSGQIKEYAQAGEAVRYREGRDGTFDNSHGEKDQKTAGFHFPDGSQVEAEHWNVWDYHTKTYRQRIKTSKPAEILVGGNLTAAGSRWLNADSRILIGGTLNSDGLEEKINNKGTSGQGRVETIGQQYLSTWEKKWYSKKRRPRRIEKEHDTYNPVRTFTHDLDSPALEYQEKASLNKPQNLTEAATTTPTAVTHSGSTPAPIKTLNTDTKLPTSSLYAINPANPSYLIETDPAFAHYKQWLGSDYMLKALNQDPNHMHKRLGDGYYEQKLINEQVARLTGYRRLDGYQNDEDQYKALMNAGVTFAQEQHLVPGVALTAEQVARLTSDIVWLETQTLTLIDGSTVNVLAPKVYLTVKPGDINAHGGLISADRLVLNSDGIVNSGTLAGRKIVDLSATDITNSGLIQGGKVGLRADDVNIEGGTVSADSLLAIDAGNIRVASTTATHGDERNGQTQIDRVAGLYVNNASDGLLSLKANQSIDFVAANLRNEAAKGQTQIVSGGRIDLGTAKLESHGKRGELTDKNHRHVHQTSEAGTAISAKGDILLSAKDGLTVRQGSIASDDGKVALSGRHVDISEGRQTLDLDESVYNVSRGLVSKQTSLDQYRRQHDEAVDSEISGSKVLIAADNDLTVRGGNVVSDDLTVLTAGNDVNITAAQSTYDDNEFHQTKKSGLMGSGGIGFTIGSKRDATDSSSRTRGNDAATVGSLKGNTVIAAEQNYRQTGSNVSAPEGDVFIQARNIDIGAAQDTYATDYQRTLEQKGLTVAINVPVIQAVQGAVAAAKTVGKSKNDRVNAMAAANTAWQTRQLLAKDSQPANLKGLSDTASALSNGDLKSAANASNISVSLTYGQQKNIDRNHTEGTTAKGSQVIGGGQVSLMADEGRLNITGSDVAGKNGTLLRAKDIVLQSAEQNHRERSSNKSSGWNAGVAVSYGQNGLAFGFTGGGNYGKGYGNGDDLTHRHSRIGDADSHTVMQSSGDTTLKGAQVSGKGIALTARNLSIESVQDSAIYRSKQQNLSGQVTFGYGASASADYSRSKINADHQSVNEQSGLFAGDDGFQVNVDNHTDLKGGIITSSEAAEQNGRNRFQTATLTQSDIRNHSRYDADGFGIGASGTLSGQMLGQKAPEAGSHIQNVAGKNSIGSTLGYGSDGGNQSSVTKSGIGTRNIVIGNDTDGTQAALVYTATRSETAEANSGRLNNAFDKEQVQNEIDLQRSVSQDFSRNVSQIKGEIDQQIDRLKAEKEVGEISEAEYRNKLQNLQYLNVGISSIATALMTPTDSALGITAAAARPAVSYRIGQYFKENEVLNQLDGGNRPTEGSKEHIALHTLNGILTGAAGGSNALLSGLASGGAELIAPTLSRSLYNKESKDLSAEEKATISSLTAVFGAAVGAASGNGSDAVAGSLTAQNTAENNDNFRLDGYTPDERSIRNYAGKIYSGDKQKAAEFIREYEKYQLTAMLKAGKEIIVDTWDTIRHPVDSAASLYETVTNPKQTYKNIVLSYQEWNTLYNNALITDIPLAARMKAEMNATIGANASAIIISGGTAALVQKSLQTGKLAQTVRVVKNTVKIPDSIPTTSINPNTIRFSQNTVSYSKIDRATGKPFTYDDLVSSMKTKGWQGEPVDIIKMPDNKLTSMDNTRIRAARDAGINVKANVHDFNDPLPDRMITSGRFGDAKTWGEAITKRISDQRPKSFGNNNPSGTPTAPKITGKSK